MKSFALSLGLLCSSSLLLSISDISCAAAAKVSKGGTRNLKAGKKGKKARCTRDVYSVVDPNASWTDHPFHTQVWYHTLDDIYKLWKEDYFDYVLDTRPLQDIDNDREGWETIHIPGSFPIDIFPPDTPANEVDMLVDFASSKVCKDARIFVYCWSGRSANMVAKTLIELGFTNVHAAGPQGSAGIREWRDAGYEVVIGDTFNAEEKRFQPACIDMCNAS
jgi:rhodanese-related sulfurtransferase